VCFSVGAYLGIFQAINVGRRGSSLLWAWKPEADGFLGYLYYFIGAMVFNISCVEPLAMFNTWPEWVRREMVWGRGLRSFTFRLNLSAFCGIGGALRGCLGGVWGCLGVCRVRACVRHG